MKTNVFVLVLSMLALFSCQSVENITTSELETLSKDLSTFNAIKVSNGLDVKLYPSNENRIKISSKVLKYIKFGVNDKGELKIYKDMPKGFNFNGKDKTLVEVWAKNVENFQANSSANLEVMGNFPAKSQTIIAASSADVIYDVQCQVLKLEASSSADIEGKIRANELYAVASSSADIEIKGHVQKAKLKARSSGDINAENVDADFVTIHASSSGDIYITVNKGIKGAVSSSGDLYYKANGAINFEVDQSSSGHVERIY